MRAFKFIHDPRAFEVVADETRRRIIYLLRAKEMTVSQIAEALGKTPQAIYHQIKKLTEVGLVEVAREERVDHFIETYYRASAEVFEFSHGEPGSAETEEHVKEAFEALGRVGVPTKAGPEVIQKVIEVEAVMSRMGLSPGLEEKIAHLEDVGFLTKSHVYKLAQFATMSDGQFEEWIKSEKALRTLIKSAVGTEQKRS
jgi:DNA-binding transcriptional ArsR family regulator